MPVDTSTTINPPEVIVTVDNGAGGGANQSVGVYVAWDPACLDVSSPNPNVGVVFMPNEGFCIWHGHMLNIGATKKFRLTMRRRNGQLTAVLACKMDPTTRIHETAIVKNVPNNHPL